MSKLRSAPKIENSKKNYIYKLETTAYLNENGNFNELKLPVESQFSNVFAINIFDFNNDGFKDILLGGNLYNVKPEVGRYDADFGQLLLGDKNLNFKSTPNNLSGLNLIGLRRAGVSNNDIKIMQKAYEMIFQNSEFRKNIDNLGSELKKNNYVQKIINFINADKKRPISIPATIK